MLTAAIFFPVLGYLLGSIPFGLIIVRWILRTDIRQIGSGNIGATNVRRAAGTWWAVVVLLCDIFKGLLPIIGAMRVDTAPWRWLTAITAVAAVCGHMYPLFLGFKPSGKGVATCLGTLLIPTPLACLVSLMVFIAAVKATRHVSAGSLIAVSALPPATWFSSGDPFLTTAALIIMILVLTRHKENLERLARGNEPRLGKP